MARAGRAADRAAAVAAARGLRNGFVAVAGPHRQSRSERSRLACRRPWPFPKFGAARFHGCGCFITTKPDLLGSTGSPDVHVPECGHARTYVTRHACQCRQFGASALLEAYIETLKAEKESLKRHLAAAKARAKWLMVRAAERERCPWWCRRLG